MAKTTLDQGVNNVRDEIAQMLEELDWLETSLVPRDELKARITAAVGEEQRRSDSACMLRALAIPIKDKYNTASFGGMFEVDTRATYVGGTNPAIMPVQVKLAPMFAWLFGDELTKNIHAKVDALEYRPGPPMAERPARRAQLLATLRELEVKEEALICTGEEAGLVIARRADADPAVVLGYDPRGTLTEVTRAPGVIVPPRGVVNAVHDQVAAVQASAPAAAPSIAQASMPPGMRFTTSPARAAYEAGMQKIQADAAYHASTQRL